MDVGRPGKSGACWRDSTKGKGFAGSSTPTMTPADLENLGHVGVSRRRAKDLRGGRRQHGRWPAWKIRGVLA